MDREIPKEVRNKERNKKIIRYGAIGVAGIVVVLSFIYTSEPTRLTSNSDAGILLTKKKH